MDLYIYNPQIKGLGVVDTFSSFRWRRKFFEPGEFELHCPATVDNLALLAEDNIIHRLDRAEAGMIEGIVINGTDNGDEITATGRFLSCKLSDRVIMPSINFTGTVENAMRKIVSDNAIIMRQIENLSLGGFNDFAQKTSFQATGKNVLTMLTALSKSSNIGYRLRLDVLSKSLIFETYQGVDHSVTQAARPYVLFSDEFNNISRPTYTSNKQGYKNYAYVAGEGEGRDRAIVIVDRTNGEPHRELWVDARDLQKGDSSDADYKEQLVQRGIEKLAECAAVESFEAAAVNTANFVYLKDWNLGDVVSFEKWGILLNRKITEVEEVYENGIATITPVCGTPLPEKLDLGSD